MSICLCFTLCFRYSQCRSCHDCCNLHRMRTGTALRSSGIGEGLDQCYRIGPEKPDIQALWKSVKSASSFSVLATASERWLFTSSFCVWKRIFSFTYNSEEVKLYWTAGSHCHNKRQHFKHTKVGLWMPSLLCPNNGWSLSLFFWEVWTNNCTNGS